MDTIAYEFSLAQAAIQAQVRFPELTMADFQHWLKAVRVDTLAGYTHAQTDRPACNHPLVMWLVQRNGQDWRIGLIAQEQLAACRWVEHDGKSVLAEVWILPRWMFRFWQATSGYTSRLTSAQCLALLGSEAV